MRVALVTPRYPPNVSGGGEISAQLLAENLGVYDDRVDEVVVFSFDGDAVEEVGGVEVRRLKRISTPLTELQNVFAYPAISGRLSSFDIVHAYNMELHPLVGYLAAREGVPSVATLNSYHFFPKSVTNVRPSGVERLYETLTQPTTGWGLRRLMHRIDAFIAISDALRGVYWRNGFRGCRIEHIPNMADPSFSVPNEPIDGDGFHLLYVGALEPHKGVEHLVRAMEHLPAHVRLRVVGGGRQKEELERLSSDVGVAHRVEFTGRLSYEEIPVEYATADAFVHPGVWPEPFGRTILEALEAGVPVVCTDIGGPPEVVPDSDLLCPPADPPALAAAVRRAMEKAPRSAAHESRRHVRSHYHPSVVVPRIVDLYTELCRDHDH